MRDSGDKSMNTKTLKKCRILELTVISLGYYEGFYIFEKHFTTLPALIAKCLRFEKESTKKQDGQGWRERREEKAGQPISVPIYQVTAPTFPSFVVRETRTIFYGRNKNNSNRLISPAV